jgi:hypothetical protein
MLPQASATRPSATRLVVVPVTVNALPGGRDAAPQLAQVRAAHRPPHHDLVPLGDQLVEGELQVGEGGDGLAVELHDGLAAADVGVGREAADVVGGDQLVGDGVVPVGLLEPTTDEGLVLLDGHRGTSSARARPRGDSASIARTRTRGTPSCRTEVPLAVGQGMAHRAVRAYVAAA